VLALAASVERDSEHPLAEAVRQAATKRALSLYETEHFESVPGLGVRAEVNGDPIVVGNARMLASTAPAHITQGLERQGKTLLLVEQAGTLIGVLAAADTIRPEVPAAIERLQTLAISTIELLTGDNERTAEAQATALRITYRAELLPEDKIRIVKEYQAQGHTVVMIGDGVNDAPALAQADVGIAMGVMGSDVALEAAHVALMREDWNLVPDLFAIAKRTMRVVKMNLTFTILYNLLGLSLAALGFLSPILAAAAQSLPDLGILANSSRLLRQKLPTIVVVPTVMSPQDPSTSQAATETCGCGNPDCCGIRESIHVWRSEEEQQA
jgi:P-type Cu+ transporter